MSKLERHLWASILHHPRLILSCLATSWLVTSNCIHAGVERGHYDQTLLTTLLIHACQRRFSRLDNFITFLVVSTRHYAKVSTAPVLLGLLFIASDVICLRSLSNACKLATRLCCCCCFSLNFLYTVRCLITLTCIGVKHSLM